MAERRRAKGEGSVYQRGDGLWIGALTVGYTANGRQKRKTVSAHTQKEALKNLRAAQRQVDEGLPPSNDTIVVSQLLERWLKHKRRRLSPSTYDNYDWAVRVHLVPAIGRKRVAKLTTSDVDDLIALKEDEGLSPSAVLRIRSVLASALDQGIVWGFVPRNVARLSEPPKRVTKEGRTLTPDQARRLLASVEGKRLETLYVLMITLGLRRGEVLGLKWSDLSTRKRTLSVERALKRENGKLVLGDLKTKGSRRILNLPDEVVKSLGSHKARQAAERLKAGEVWQESGLIFTTEIGSPIDPRNLHRDFVKVSEAAGLGRWHLHELRHSATSLMLSEGIPLKVVADVMGHSSVRMTADVYGHVLTPQRQEAADAMATVLWRSNEVND
jgi:integrase